MGLIAKREPDSMSDTVIITRKDHPRIVPSHVGGVCTTPALKPPAKLAIVSFAVTTDCNLLCKGCGRTKGVAKGIWQNENMLAN